MAVLVGSALVVAPIVTAVQAEAAGDPPDFFICVGATLLADVSGASDDVITPGADADIVVSIEVQEWEAGSRPTDFDDRCVPLPAEITPTTPAEVILRLIDEAAPTPALNWSVLDASLIAGATPDAEPPGVTWTVTLDQLRTGDVGDFFFDVGRGTVYDPAPAGYLSATTVESVILVAVRDDLSPGAYRLNIQLIVETDPGPPQVLETFPALVPFEVVGAASSTTVSPSPGPSATVSCGEPVAGAVVTCTLRSVEEFDFLWEASTNPVFTGGVVTTDAAGVGEFSFSVPADAVGQEVLVRIVDWTRAEPIGVASGPVPSSVPAGERGEMPVGMLVMLLLGVVALLGGITRVRTEVGGVSRVSR